MERRDKINYYLDIAEAVLNPQDQAFVDKATRLVLAHLSDTNFNIDRLCREMAMSRTLEFVAKIPPHNVFIPLLGSRYRFAYTIRTAG